MTRPEVSELIEILNAETELLKMLHSILAEEQGALVSGNIEDLRRNVEAQLSILGDIAILEKRRKNVLRDLGDMTAEPGQVKLDAIVQEISGEEAERLREIRASLREITDALGTVNKSNGMLIKQSLSYIDNTLKVIAGEDDSSRVYTADGEITCRTGQIVLNDRI